MSNFQVHNLLSWKSGGYFGYMRISVSPPPFPFGPIEVVASSPSPNLRPVPPFKYDVIHTHIYIIYMRIIYHIYIYIYNNIILYILYKYIYICNSQHLDTSFSLISSISQPIPPCPSIPGTGHPGPRPGQQSSPRPGAATVASAGRAMLQRSDQRRPSAPGALAPEEPKEPKESKEPKERNSRSFKTFSEGCVPVPWRGDGSS